MTPLQGPLETARDAGCRRVVERDLGLGDEHRVGAGQVQPEVGRAAQHGGRLRASGQKRVEHLLPRRLLTAREVTAGPLEAVRERRHAVVRRPEHAQPGSPHLLGRATADRRQLGPQPPARRQVQVDQRSWRHPCRRGSGAALAAALELDVVEAPPGRGSVHHGVQEPPQQGDVQAAGVLGGTFRDGVEIHVLTSPSSSGPGEVAEHRQRLS